MEACYGGTDVMERSCAVARGIDINTVPLFQVQVGPPGHFKHISIPTPTVTALKNYYSEFHIAPQTSAAKPQGTAARALIYIIGTTAIFVPESLRAPKSVFKNSHFWRSCF